MKILSQKESGAYHLNCEHCGHDSEAFKAVPSHIVQYLVCEKCRKQQDGKIVPVFDPSNM